MLHLIERDFVADVIEIMEALSAHGEVFQLWNPEEHESMVNQVRYKTMSSNHRGMERTESQIVEDIRESIHENLHLLL